MRSGSAMSRSSLGRRAFAPEIPVSTHSPATAKPRRSQYSRNSRNCISGDWPLFDVLILAYRAVRVMLWAATRPAFLPTVLTSACGLCLCDSFLACTSELSARRGQSRFVSPGLPDSPAAALEPCHRAASESAWPCEFRVFLQPAPSSNSALHYPY